MGYDITLHGVTKSFDNGTKMVPPLIAGLIASRRTRSVKIAELLGE